MAKKKHKAFPLAGSTKILRAHSTDIEPPGLVEFRNLFTSRSDNAVALRSDWEAAYAGMFSYGDLIQGGDHEDYLNSAFYVTRAGHTIWLGRFCPFTWSGDFGQMFTIYEEGTIATDGVKMEVVGTGTEWLQQIWPGCLIKFTGEGNDLYPITDVTSDTRILTSAIMPASSAVDYQIFRVHPAGRAEWPMRVAALGGNLIYGTVDMNQPVDQKYISGPFFANINRPNLGVWFGTDPTLDDVDMNFTTLAVSRGWGPILVGGDQGSIFGRENANPVLFWEDQHLTDTKAVECGSLGETFTYLSPINSGTCFALTLEGNVYELQLVTSSPYNGIRNRYTFQGGLENTYRYEKPFGSVSLFGIFRNRFVVGDGGLLGYLDTSNEPPVHATYATGTTVTLRGASEQLWMAGGHESRYIVVGDDDGTDAVILDVVLYDGAFSSVTARTSGVVGESLTSVVVGLDRFLVAVGTGGTCITSPDDGVTWTPRTVGTTEDLEAIAVDDQGTRFVAVGESIFFSLDGITWNEQLTAVSFIDVKFCRDNSRFYLLDENQDVWVMGVIAYIGDGTSTDMGSFGAASDFVCDLHHDGSQFVAVGNKIWTSPDAVTWTERAVPTETMVSVVKDEAGGLIWVAVGLNGAIYRSADDGVNWAAVTSGTTENLNCVTITVRYVGWSYFSFVACGESGTVLRSEDGATWTLMIFPSDTNLLAIDELPPSNSSDGPNNSVNLCASGQDGHLYIIGHNSIGTWGNWGKWEGRTDSIVGSGVSDSWRVRAAAYSLATPPGISGYSGGIIGTSPEAALVVSGASVWMHEQIPTLRDPFQYPGHCDTSDFWGIDEGQMISNGVNALYSSYFASGLEVLFYRYKGTGTTWGIFDMLVTSIDHGVTWSAIAQGYDNPRQGQSFNQGYRSQTYLNGKLYLPISYDGTDVFIIQSSKRKATKPRALKHSGWKIQIQSLEKI